MAEESDSSNQSNISMTSDNEVPQDPLNEPIYIRKKNKNFFKIIREVGDGYDKPGTIDEVTLKLTEYTEEEPQELPEPTTLRLGSRKLLAALEEVITTMRAEETAITEIPSELAEGTQRKFKLKVISWVSVHDLKADGTLIKRILKKGFGYDRVDFKDDVEVHFKVTQGNKTLLEKQNFKSSVEPENLPEGLIEILKSMKLQEHSQVLIEENYFRSNFKECLSELSEGEICAEVEVVELQKVEDMYLDGSFYKRLIEDGGGKNLPNSNARVRVQYKLEVGSEVVLSNFEEDLLELIMDEDEVPSVWTHCLRQMKEGDLVKVECNLMGLHSHYLSDGLDPKYNFDTYTKEGVHSAVFYIKLVSFDMGKVNYNMTNQDRLNEALRIKEAGTKLFKVSRFEKALEKYETANSTLEPISDDPHNFRPLQMLIYGNITLCHIKLQNWHEAENFANKVLDYNPQEVKALFRRGLARKGLTSYENSLSDLKLAKESSETNNPLLKSIEEEIKRVQMLRKKHYSKEKQLYSKIFSNK